MRLSGEKDLNLTDKYILKNKKVLISRSTPFLFLKQPIIK
jgi:hypothetical protein